MGNIQKSSLEKGNRARQSQTAPIPESETEDGTGIRK